MPLPHAKFRELVFCLLYSEDFAASAEEDSIPFLMEQLAVTRKALREAWQRKEEVKQRLEAIDQLIARHARAYAFSRIPGTEKNILRLSVFELLYDAAIPPKVAIAEAIRLSRKFATPEGGTFVQAILDGVAREAPHAPAAIPAEA
jgi:N utilization substance protein B